MIEENKYIDKMFQEKLGERTFEVPAAFLADLEKRLDLPVVASKGIKGYWFWLSAIAVTGFAIATYFGVSPTEKDNNALSVVKSAMPSTLTSSLSDEIAFSKVTSTTPLTRTSSNDPNYNSFVNNKNQAQLGQNKKQSKAERKWITDSIQNTQRTPKHIPASVTKVRQSQNINFKGNSTKDEIFEGLLALNTIPTTSEVYKLLVSDASFGSQNMTKQKIQTGKSYIHYLDDTLKGIRYILRDSLIIRDSVIIHDSIRWTDQTNTAPIQTSKPTRNAHLELQVFGGMMAVRSKTISPFQGYSEALAANHKNIISPDFGFALNAYYKGWTAGTGLNYYHFGEKSEFSTKKTETYETYDVSTFYQYIQDSSGMLDSFLVTQIDTNFFSTFTSKAYSVTNTYSQFSIPFRFGYSITRKDWQFIPRLGLNFEFALSKRAGVYVNDEGTELFEIKQRNFGLSYQVSFELRKAIKNWHVFVNPYYRNNINFLLDSPELQRKYGGFGATVGIGLRF